MEILRSRNDAVKLYLLVVWSLVQSSCTIVLGPSDVEVVKKSSREESSNLPHPRKERAVTQTQKDALVDAINYQRSQVGASNMEYVTWNNTLQNKAQQWTDNCDYDAILWKTSFDSMFLYLHGIKNADQGFDDSYQGYIDLLQTTVNNGTLSRFYNNFMQYDLQSVGCGIKSCRSLRTHAPQYTYDNFSLTLCVFSYANSLSVKAPGSPGVYSSGQECTNCISGSYWCNHGLCKRDCSSTEAACSCIVDCLFCDYYSSTTCSCCSPYCSGFNFNVMQCSSEYYETTSRKTTLRTTTTRTTTATTGLPGGGFAADSSQNDVSLDSVTIMSIVLSVVCGVFGVVALVIGIVCFVVCRLCRKTPKPRNRRGLSEHRYEVPDASQRLPPPPAYSPPLPSAPVDQPYTILNYPDYSVISTQTESPPPYPGTGLIPLEAAPANSLPPPAYSLESAFRQAVITVQSSGNTGGENEIDQPHTGAYTELAEEHLYSNVSARTNPAFEGDYMPMNGNKN